jgi:hypothetical protein
MNSLRELYAKVVAIQNHLVELNREADGPCPITFEFKRLRKPSRLPNSLLQNSTPF